MRAGLLAAVIPMLLVASPAPAAADICSAQAWVEYNRCLVQNCGWFEKTLCDAAYMLDQAACLIGAME